MTYTSITRTTHLTFVPFHARRAHPEDLLQSRHLFLCPGIILCTAGSPRGPFTVPAPFPVPRHHLLHGGLSPRTFYSPGTFSCALASFIARRALPEDLLQSRHLFLCPGIILCTAGYPTVLFTVLSPSPVPCHLLLVAFI